MTTYVFPRRDFRFLFDALNLGELAELPGFHDATVETVEQILDEAGRFCSEVLLPLNRESDEVGVRLENGQVYTPPGFVEAYRAFCDGGWTGLTGPVAYGGQGLPETLAYCLSEIMASACMSFAQYPSLTHGACIAIEAHANETLKDTYLSKLISGEWTGTMCLTESQAGTDLGLLRTRAVPKSDGAYAITGSKIFITGGEHDLAENIVHLVLAKLPDAPPGVRGISLFLVPKFIPNVNGKPGDRNKVTCGSVEHKMGMKGSCACVMNFEDATGYLVGEPHKGLRAMFTMMNTERLLLSAQGPGTAEVAYQSATEYARGRLQGRSARGPIAPKELADPIIVHPDVRRMLLTIKAHAEGNRALALWVMKQVDFAARHPDRAVRERAEAFVALMTPVVKVCLSDNGSEAANLGVQVFGGHGFIREWGMEQLVRDIRILQLYEGANGIQALDLVARKLPMANGQMLKVLTDEIETFVEDHNGRDDVAEFVRPVEEALARLRRATDAMLTEAGANPDALGAASMDYLKIVGFTAQAYIWALLAVRALGGLETLPPQESRFVRSKLGTARFFFAKLLPAADYHLHALQAGAEPVMALEAEEV